MLILFENEALKTSRELFFGLLAANSESKVDYRPITKKYKRVNQQGIIDSLMIIKMNKKLINTKMISSASKSSKKGAHGVVYGPKPAP